jgi:hypothetical protein
MTSRSTAAIAIVLVACAGSATAAAVAALAPRAPVPQTTPVQADPAHETFAFASLALDRNDTSVESKHAKLKYWTLSWSAEAAKRMRQSAELRADGNKRAFLTMQTELKLPMAVSVDGRRLEPDVYRVWLRMNDAGAFELSYLLSGEEIRVPVDVSETRQNSPYLEMSLVPSPVRGFELVYHWGTEYGRVPFVVLDR